MKYNLQLTFFLVVLIHTSCQGLVDKKVDKTVITSDYSEVTYNSAKLSGFISPDYLNPGIEVGIIISTNPNPTLDNGDVVIAQEIDKNNRFSVYAWGLSPETTYYYKAFINLGSYIVGDINSFTTTAFIFEAVDLGLSVKWCNTNLGAKLPEDTGSYYAWGELIPKDYYSWESYKWYKEGAIIKYGIGDTNVLEEDDDAAHVLLGGKWRIPSTAELRELSNTRNNQNYYWERKAIKGKKGWVVAYLLNGNSIFLPAAGYQYELSHNGVGIFGYYWSSEINYAGFMSYANYLEFDDTKVSVNVFLQDYPRFCGATIRPVEE